VAAKKGPGQEDAGAKFVSTHRRLLLLGEPPIAKAVCALTTHLAHPSVKHP
jgi:hypothetical protein